MIYIQFGLILVFIVSALVVFLLSYKKVERTGQVLLVRKMSRVFVSKTSAICIPFLNSFERVDIRQKK